MSDSLYNRNVSNSGDTNGSLKLFKGKKVVKRSVPLSIKISSNDSEAAILAAKNASLTIILCFLTIPFDINAFSESDRV